MSKPIFYRIPASALPNQIETSARNPKRTKKAGWEAATAWPIPSENMATFTAKMEKLQKRAKKIGAPVPEFRDLGFRRTFRKVEHAYSDEVVAVDTHWVVVSGEAPQIGGWSFRASILAADGDKNLLVSNPEAGDFSIPKEYRNADPKNCDHCKQIRKRNETFLLESEEGEWIQVGSSCLKDFLGHDSPTGLARFSGSLRQMLLGFSDPDSMDYREGQARAWPLASVYKLVVAQVEAFGFLSWTKANEDPWEPKTPTSHIVRGVLQAKTETKGMKADAEKRAAVELSEDRMTEALQWAIAEGEKEDSSDFAHNLGVVASQEYITSSMIGLFTALWPCFLRAEERKAANADALGSEFQGKPGENLLVWAEIVQDKVTGSTFAGYDTEVFTHLYVFRDEAGNRYKTFTSGGPDRMAEGRWVLLDAKVREHSEWNGVKETMIKISRNTGIVEGSDSWIPNPDYADMKTAIWETFCHADKAHPEIAALYQEYSEALPEMNLNISWETIASQIVLAHFKRGKATDVKARAEALGIDPTGTKAALAARCAEKWETLYSFA